MRVESSHQGAKRLRRLLSRMDPEDTQQLKDVLKAGAEKMASTMRNSVPVDTGELRDSIGTKAARKGLSQYIGPGAASAHVTNRGFKAVKDKVSKKTGRLTAATIKNKHARMQLYKANWIEHGTKGHGKIPARPARPFINPAFDAHRDATQAQVADAIRAALIAAAAQ